MAIIAQGFSQKDLGELAGILGFFGLGLELAGLPTRGWFPTATVFISDKFTVDEPVVAEAATGLRVCKARSSSAAD